MPTKENNQIMWTSVILKLIVIIDLLLLNVNTNEDDDQDPDYSDRYSRPRSLKYYKTEQRKGRTSVRVREDIFSDLVNPKLSVDEVTSRLPTKTFPIINTRVGGYCKTSACFSCLESCKWLKKSKYSALDITQYTYLRLCSEGCKDNLACLVDNYCLPVMEENPDYFILCSNKCNLFEVIPQIFRTGQCK